MHTDNQQKFGLPTRHLAKIFVFRLIYGGSAWAYVLDPSFAEGGKNVREWQSVIDAFYHKYPLISKTHDRWVQEVAGTGKLVMPTGREYHYIRYMKQGELQWPRTTILNYPVQGLGADLVAILRVLIYKYLMESKLEAKLICTVHDSVDIDAPSHEVQEVLKIYQRAFEQTPKVFERTFGVEFNVPFKGECFVGPNLKDLIPV